MPNVNTEGVALNSIRTSRRLSREVSIGDTNAVEVYYRDGSSVGVPFLWESHPGTPKMIRSRKTPLLPPLTPPPSYLSNSNSRKPGKIKNASKLSFNKTLSPQLCSPSTPSSSSSSSWSVPSSPFRVSKELKERRCSSPRMSFDSGFDIGSRMEEDDHCDDKSPVSTLCFRAGRGTSGSGRSRGCSSSIVKLLLREFA